MVMASEAADPRLGPGIVASGAPAETVERRRDGAAVLLARQRTDQLPHPGVAAVAVLARPVARHAEPCVVSTPPVQEQLDPILGQRGDGHLEDCAQDALAGLCSCSLTGAGRVQIRAARRPPFRLRRGQRGLARANGGAPLFPSPYLPEPVVPAAFELGGDQAVRGIDRVVLGAGEIRLVRRACTSASSAWRRVSAIPASRGATAASAASTRMPPTAMQVCVP